MGRKERRRVDKQEKGAPVSGINTNSAARIISQQTHKPGGPIIKIPTRMEQQRK